MTDYSILIPPSFESDEAYHRWLDTLPIYQTAEERKQLFDVRDRIFANDEGGVIRFADSIFRCESWDRVIIRGSLLGSDRSREPDDRYSDVEYWRNDDPRDPLYPLLQLLYDDGVEEIIHASPYIEGDKALFVGAPVNTKGLRCSLGPGYLENRMGAAFVGAPLFFVTDTERIIFDRTGRWGMYASCEEFGLLGGEPEFMARYVEKAGGWDFIREKADKFWQEVVNYESHAEKDLVDHYYKLAGWDDPPQRSEN